MIVFAWRNTVCFFRFNLLNYVRDCMGGTRAAARRQSCDVHSPQKYMSLVGALRGFLWTCVTPRPEAVSADGGAAVYNPHEGGAVMVRPAFQCTKHHENTSLDFMTKLKFASSPFSRQFMTLWLIVYCLIYHEVTAQKQGRAVWLPASLLASFC